MQIKKAKSISKPGVQKNIKHDDYVKCLRHSEVMSHEIMLIRSSLHHMGMYRARQKK